jgi:hypothetical protein
MNLIKEQLWLQTWHKDSLVEAVGFEPSAVPSDEDRLAADVSTTRLQTKRLSGA